MPEARPGGPSAHDAVAQVHDLGCADLTDQLELHGVGGQLVEQPLSLAEQDGYDVQLELVELAGPQQRLGGAGSVHRHVGVARRLPRGGRAGSTSVMNRTLPGGGSSGTSWVSTKIGTPSWWSPCQWLASS